MLCLTHLFLVSAPAQLYETPPNAGTRARVQRIAGDNMCQTAGTRTTSAILTGLVSCVTFQQLRSMCSCANGANKQTTKVELRVASASGRHQLRPSASP